MAKRKESVAILTYNLTDGACAAAAVLLAHPQASILPTSQAVIARDLASLAKGRSKPTHVYVCGVGIVDWEQARKAAQQLRKAGCEITWICGRGYLDGSRSLFEEISTPAFLATGTNTAAAVQHLALSRNPRAAFLMELAEHDSRLVSKASHQPNPEEQKWLDLIAATVGQYFKFEDRLHYHEVIPKLARDEFNERDQMLIKQHKVYEYRYLINGKSPVIRRLRETIGRVALAGDKPVLILGESGVGKEHAARLIHERSGMRATGPFKAVNCALFAGNEGLVNSELFGHIKGSFTGANTARDGAFISARGGVLFLDEFGDLPLSVQGKLLRVVEDGEVSPVGADDPLKERADVRLIAATNRDLPAMIREGTFRADLFHRLSILSIQIPPLRERTDDIKRIAQETIGRLRNDGFDCKLSKPELDALKGYNWPGNVRQLIKVVERAALLQMKVGEVLKEEESLGDLHQGHHEYTHADDKLHPSTPEQIISLDEAKSEYANRALTLMDGNKKATAEKLGITRTTIQKLIKDAQ